MARQLFQHVIQKANAGLDIETAGAVDIDSGGNLSFGGLAVDGGLAHGRSRTG